MERKKNTHPEIEIFNNLWRGGYYEGNPLDPVGASSYKRVGYLSVLYATYLGCIKPYVNNDSVVLEIGPGRGAWTRCMLNAREIWCLDAKSREDNGIDKYLGSPDNLRYHKVDDFSCSTLPDNYFTYVFSFGTFCHISFEGVSQYARNMYSKLKNGAHCFWMLSDYDQSNHISDNFKQYDITFRTLPYWFYTIIEILNKCKNDTLVGRSHLPRLDKNELDDIRPEGRWYNNGLERVAGLLKDSGYEVVEKDVGFALRDPIIHFVKR